MLFERRCPGCGTDTRFVCENCWSQLAVAPPAPAGRALFVYDGLGRDIVLAAKNGGRRDLWRPLGRALAVVVAEPVDVVTWVPAGRANKRERGYDQGRLLARSVAAKLKVPHLRLLRRIDRAGQAGQTGQSREQRLLGPQLVARGSGHQRVLIVDDVRTTGASLRAAAEALRDAGAEQVITIALAVSL